MKILLIAYEYPPIIAAQALRWFYLTNELAALGHHVHVICPRLSMRSSYPAPAFAGVIEHRSWPGPFIAFSQWVSTQAGTTKAGDEAVSNTDSIAFRLYRYARCILDTLLYPDVRTEWYPFARHAIGTLLEQEKFDVIISSHEPGVDLLLGLWAKRRFGLPWIVDLADPLYAPYSPRWRRRLDRWVEGRVIQRSDKVLLTTDQLGGLLIERHGSATGAKYVCVPQGTPSRPMSGLGEGRLVNGKMNIVFTGNFYEAFRNPVHFAHALKQLASNEIAVTIVGDNDRFKPLFDGVPDVLFLGKSSHFYCLALQGDADVLLNFGNAQSYQIPGKLYEYLAAGRPILHIRNSNDDPGVDLLKQSGLGVVVDNDSGSIAAALTALLERWRAGRLSVSESVTLQLQAQHGWRTRAQLISDIIADIVGY